MTGTRAVVLLVVCLALGHRASGSQSFFHSALGKLVQAAQQQQANSGNAEAPNRRILDGTAVTDQCVAPYNSLVNIIKIIDGDTNEICVGTLLEQDIVVTAVRCANSMAADTLNEHFAVLGDRYYDSVDNGEQRISIAAIKIHPNYVRNNDENDDNNIALLKLSTPATLGPCAQLMTRYESAQDTSCPTYQTTCRIAGWGSTHPSDSFDNFAASPYLRYGDVNVYTDSGLVSVLMAQDYPDETLAEGVSMIASALPGEFVGTCRYDWGTMVACDDGTGQYVLRGVLSNHDKCSATPIFLPLFPYVDPERPMYVVDIEQYKYWIDGCIGADFTDTSACPGDVVTPA